MVKSDESGQRSFIRYNPERIDLTVTEYELKELQSAGQNNMKDFFLVTISIAVPCLTNAVTTTTNPFQLSLGLFLNYLIGGICLLGAIFSLIQWLRSASNLKILMKTIREKPKLAIQIGLESGIASAVQVDQKTTEITNGSA